MIRNKAAKALIIGTFLFASSMIGVYADTNTPVTKPAIVDPAKGDSQTYTIQIESVKNQDALTQKQQEIDKYVFEDHKKDLEQKGITVNTTCVVGDYVEVGITPFNEANAKYFYDIFGKDMVKVVEGQQAVTLDTASATAEKAAALTSAPVDTPKNTSIITTIINSIIEWFKSIF